MSNKVGRPQVKNPVKPRIACGAIKKTVLEQILGLLSSDAAHTFRIVSYDEQGREISEIKYNAEVIRHRPKQSHSANAA
jgi:hypothetical protein